MTGGGITPAIVKALAGVEYDEDAQHTRAMNAMSLVRDDIADGRAPDRRLVGIALACACRPCLDGMVEQARELGPWLAVAKPSPLSPVERFVADCCDVAPARGDAASPAEVLAAFRQWAHANDEDTAMSTVKLGRELSARFGVRSVASSGRRVYTMLALQAGWDLSAKVPQ